MLSKSRSIQIPSGKNMCAASRPKQNPPGKHDLDRADHAINREMYHIYQVYIPGILIAVPHVLDHEVRDPIRPMRENSGIPIFKTIPL